MLLELPAELVSLVLRRLEARAVRSVALTCRRLHALVLQEHSLWRARAARARLVLRPRSSYITPYQICRLSHNWCEGIYRDKVILRHYTSYMPWLSLRDDCLLLSTGSKLTCFPRDARGLPTCKETLWTIDVPKVKRRGVRTNDISRFVAKDNVVVCGNRDGCISVYELFDAHNETNNTTTNLPILTQHIRDCHNKGRVEVTTVDSVVKDRSLYCIVSGSSDRNEVKFWKEREQIEDVGQHYLSISSNSSESLNQSTFSCARRVTFPCGIGAKCLLLNRQEDQLIVGLEGNSKPLLLDVETGDVLLNPVVYKSTRQVIKDITWMSDNSVAYVTHSGYLNCVDTRTGQTTYHVMDPFAAAFYCLKSDGDRAIVAGSCQYSRCVLFDIRKPANHVQIYFTHKNSSPVYSLDFDLCVLVAAADKSVATLDFDVNVSSVTRRNYSEPFQLIC